MNAMNRNAAIAYLNIPEKHFDNFLKKSAEIKGFKHNGRWYFEPNCH